MQGIRALFYTYELEKQHGMTLYEWLLEQAPKLGFWKCVVMRGIAGYDCQGKIHEEHFFELASDVPVVVEIIDEKLKIDHFLQELEAKKVSIFYTTAPLDFGITGKGS